MHFVFLHPKKILGLRKIENGTTEMIDSLTLSITNFENVFSHCISQGQSLVLEKNIILSYQLWYALKYLTLLQDGYENALKQY